MTKKYLNSFFLSIVILIQKQHVREKKNYLIRKLQNKNNKDTVGILKIYLVQKVICIVRKVIVFSYIFSSTSFSYFTNGKNYIKRKYFLNFYLIVVIYKLFFRQLLLTPSTFASCTLSVICNTISVIARIYKGEKWCSEWVVTVVEVFWRANMVKGVAAKLL